MVVANIDKELMTLEKVECCKLEQNIGEVFINNPFLILIPTDLLAAALRTIEQGQDQIKVIIKEEQDKSEIQI